MKNVRPVILLALCMTLGYAGLAQDTRNVKEPSVPPVCTSLVARLAEQNGQLAEADESKLDTLRIQNAIDRCTPGSAVALRSSGSNDAFLSGPLKLKKGITLLVTAGTTLFGSRNPRDYDVTPGACGKVDHHGRGCKPLILARNAPGSGVMGDGVIDGRGGATLLGQDVTWWGLAHQAKVENAAQNCPRIIVVERSDNFTLYRITLQNSPNFHVIVNRTNGFTAWGVKANSPKTARNTDCIDPSASTNVSILHSYLHCGDDNVAIKAGNAGPSSHITVAYDHFYTGHGMSIGSETNGGVSDVDVHDLTIDGADNGIRIKSNSTKGGLVTNVSYTNICIRDVKNPIVMDPFYSTERGSLVPVFQNITLHNVRILTPGKITLLGTDAQHLLRVTFDGVLIDNFRPKQIRAAHARFTLGPGEVNFTPEGDDVESTRISGSRAVPSCDGKFVPFPGTAETQDNSGPAVAAKQISLVVAQDGSGNYRSVQAAVDALPDSGGTIHIKPGTYREVVHVRKPNVRIEGDSKDPAKVVIVYDNSAGKVGGTFKSATFFVEGDNFFALGVTFVNDFTHFHQLQPEGSQAVALFVRADRAVFRDVRILGAQDTLYAASKGCSSDQGPCTPAREYFSHCYIEGNVDFIFGDAETVFHDCEIHAIAHKTVYLTAQSKHYPQQKSGYVFDHCKVTADAGATNIFLGRPWRPYSTVVFLHTDLTAHIQPAGWHEWHEGETHSLETATYAEFESTGPGADPAHREPLSRQLTASQAKAFSPSVFLAGQDHWNPSDVR